MNHPVEDAGTPRSRKPLTVALTATRGKRKNFTVQPLPDVAPQRDWLTELTNAGNDLVAIGALGQQATQAGAPADMVQQIRDKYNAVKGEQS